MLVVIAPIRRMLFPYYRGFVAMEFEKISLTPERETWSKSGETFDEFLERLNPENWRYVANNDEVIAQTVLLHFKESALGEFGTWEEAKSKYFPELSAG